MDFLVRMAAMAVAWRPEAREPSPREVLASPELAHYLVGWPHDGDGGVIAEVAEPIGAAWYRRFSIEAHGYGFVAPDVPEISIAVVQGWRGRGIGRRLMEELMLLAAEAASPVSASAWSRITRSDICTARPASARSVEWGAP